VTTKQKTPSEEGVSAVLTGVPPEGGIRKAQSGAEPFSLSIPKIGGFRTEDHEYYWNGAGPYPSVTNVLDVIQKWGIYYGGLKKVATAAVDRWEEVGGLLMGDAVRTAGILFDGPITQTEVGAVGEPGTLLRRHAVTAWLKDLPNRERDVAAQIGSGVHHLADMLGRSETAATGFEVSAEEKPFIEAYRGFMAFLEAHKAVIISSERMVFSLDGYAGTYDQLIRFQCPCHGGLWMVDTKTSATGPYPEWALQLIAYGTADYIIVEDNPDPYPMPVIQRYGVLHLRPDLYTDTGWRLIEYPLVPEDRMAFLGALEIWRWKDRKRYTKSQLAKAQKG